ncbi:hypothetical protein [Burkholderia thailandensis]|uniref:hypothetical protein n=1 Tax=Burkholderia thailandensis TaxID=57975 RepID=UPI001EE2612E|nr:hypothetical protein [Burkholderia thailandensis]
MGEVPREIGGRYVERERNGKTAVGLLYAVKAGVGIGSTLALGLTMLSSSATLFERIASSITGHKIRIAILNRIGQGIADATARKVAIAIGEKVIAIAAERAGRWWWGGSCFYGWLGDSGGCHCNSSSDLIIG